MGSICPAHCCGSSERPQNGAREKRRGDASAEEALGPGTFMGADGARAWVSRSRSLNVPILGKVNHQQKVFTPVAKLLKSSLTKLQRRTFSASSKGPAPATEVGRKFFWAAGGDNSAESALARLKNSMRRMQTVGRGNANKGELKSIQSLAAAALLREAGYERVLAALAMYRRALSEGHIHMPPADAFTAEKCDWIYGSEDFKSEG